MPVLKNPRHERFAQELAKGKTADEAYQLAGYKANRGNATRLKANESVVVRLAEIQGRVAQRAEVTLHSLNEKLEEARANAIEDRQNSAAVSACAVLAKINGFMVDRQIVMHIDLTTLTDDEFEQLRRVRALIAERGSIRAGGSAPGRLEAPADNRTGRRLQS